MVQDGRTVRSIADEQMVVDSNLATFVPHNLAWDVEPVPILFIGHRVTFERFFFEMGV